MATLSDRARTLLEDRAHATVATTGADGSPRQSVVWVAIDGGDVVFSTLRGRVRTRNLESRPGVDLLVIDPADPGRYVEVRGTASITDDGGPELIQSLSRNYTGQDYTGDGPADVRVVVRIDATRIIERG